MMDKVRKEALQFDGDEYCYYVDDDESLRAHFKSTDGSVPPLRGIVKAFGQEEELLTTAPARKVLHDTITSGCTGLEQPS